MVRINVFNGFVLEVIRLVTRRLIILRVMVGRGRIVWLFRVGIRVLLFLVLLRYGWVVFRLFRRRADFGWLTVSMVTRLLRSWRI